MSEGSFRRRSQDGFVPVVASDPDLRSFRSIHNDDEVVVVMEPEEYNMVTMTVTGTVHNSNSDSGEEEMEVEEAVDVETPSATCLIQSEDSKEENASGGGEEGGPKEAAGAVNHALVGETETVDETNSSSCLV